MIKIYLVKDYLNDHMFVMAVKKRSDCRKERFTYYARKADDSYKELITECRKGINLTEEEIYKINKRYL